MQKLIPGLEKHRSIEMAERKEKRKKHNAGDKEPEKDEKSEKEQPSSVEGESRLYPAKLNFI